MTVNKKDVTEKKLMAYNDVFSVIFNGLVIYGTGLVIDPDDLEDARVRSVYVPLSDEDNSAREQERDIAKFWKKEGVILCLMGLENQTAIDRYMPLRIIGYEGADYRSQVTERDEAARVARRKGDIDGAERVKSRKFYPVITAVLYYGTKRRWDKYKSLCECLDIPEGLEGIVEDRHIRVIELAWLTDEEMSRLKGDAWLLADALRQMRMYGRYEYKDLTAIEHVEAMLMFLKECTGRKKLFEEGLLKYEQAQREGRGFTMDDIFAGIYNDGIVHGRNEGLAIGRNEGLAIGRNEGLAIGRNEGLAIGRNEGLAIGRNEGLAIGRNEERERGINFLRDAGFSQEVIDRYINYSNADHGRHI